MSESHYKDGQKIRHTTVECPILEIPIMETAINTYKNQIVITAGDSRLKGILQFKNIRDQFENKYERPNYTFCQRIRKLTIEIIAIFFTDTELSNIFTAPVKSLPKSDAFNFN